MGRAAAYSSSVNVDTRLSMVKMRLVQEQWAPDRLRQECRWRPGSLEDGRATPPGRHTNPWTRRSHAATQQQAERTLRNNPRADRPGPPAPRQVRTGSSLRRDRKSGVEGERVWR